MPSSMIPAPPVVAPPIVASTITPPPIVAGYAVQSAEQSGPTHPSMEANHRSPVWMGIGIGLLAGVILLLCLLPIATSSHRYASATHTPASHPTSLVIPSVGVDLEFAPTTVNETRPPLHEPEAGLSASADQLDRDIPIASVSFQEVLAPKPLIVEPEAIATDAPKPAREIVEPPTISPTPLAADLMELKTLGTLELLETFPAPPQCEVGTTCAAGTCPSNLKSHGTALAWADSLDDARRMAQSEKKLVFLIHISGNFEIPGFT